MHITLQISSDSPEKLEIAEKMAREETDLNRVFIDHRWATPGGVETHYYTDHKLSDSFNSVCVEKSEKSFTLRFDIKKDADNFWKDLMVITMKNIKNTGVNVEIHSMWRGMTDEQNNIR